MQLDIITHNKKNNIYIYTYTCTTKTVQIRPHSTHNKTTHQENKPTNTKQRSVNAHLYLNESKVKRQFNPVCCFGWNYIGRIRDTPPPYTLNTLSRQIPHISSPNTQHNVDMFHSFTSHRQLSIKTPCSLFKRTNKQNTHPGKQFKWTYSVPWLKPTRITHTKEQL